MATLPIKTKDGNLSIELERHDKTPDEIPRNPDAIVIEYPYWQQVFDSVKKGNSLESSLTNIEDSKHYLEIISLAKQKGIPLFFPDVEIKEEYGEEYYKRRHLKEGFIASLSVTAAGSALIRSAYLKKNKKISRREFLARTAAITGALALINEFMANADLTRNKVIGKKNLEKAFVELFESLDIDPLIELRNAVMVEKLERLLPKLRKTLGRKPNVYMILGRWHAGIEHYFHNPELRNEVLRYFIPLNKYLNPGFRRLGEINFVKGKPKLRIHKDFLEKTFLEKLQRKIPRRPSEKHLRELSRRELFANFLPKLKKRKPR